MPAERGGVWSRACGDALEESGQPLPYLISTPAHVSGFFVPGVLYLRRSVITAGRVSVFLELRISVGTMTDTRAGPRRLSEVGRVTSRELDAEPLDSWMCDLPRVGCRTLEFWMAGRVFVAGLGAAVDVVAVGALDSGVWI